MFPVGQKGEEDFSAENVATLHKVWNNSSGIPVDLNAEERLDIFRIDLLNLYLLSVLCKGVVLRIPNQRQNVPISTLNKPALQYAYLRHFPTIDLHFFRKIRFSLT